MLDEEFWNIIKNIDNSKLDLLEEDDYPEELMEPLILALSKLDEKNIKGFEEKLSEFLYALDGEIYANNAGESGESGDGFLYARCWIVAKGKKYYERILATPREMPKSISNWCEPLIYVSSAAWSMSTGKDEEDWDFAPSLSYETGSNSSLW